MAVTVETGNANKHVTGLTTGNEYIWEVPTGATVTIEGVNTSAGTARVRYSLQASAPTDFTNFTTSTVGDHTATFAEASTGYPRWIGLEIDSGTWSANITFVK